ncbi:hypothetical protein BD324DRAFT_626451 [Kockovaella imperatae]|uniref:Spermidine synthase n=1 Tax=Kockovaella imperatae TaxID=4999 RepID=A0A1Y1UEX6_9TREE|nr:hypothetical protein BD324DRAFT_626451 [Kockovaella imperatae]ORX36593.1 hypothetical protein BD324DRAFT_626451 [Kockovaella imperatae]
MSSKSASDGGEDQGEAVFEYDSASPMDSDGRVSEASTASPTAQKSPHSADSRSSQSSHTSETVEPRQKSWGSPTSPGDLSPSSDVHSPIKVSSTSKLRQEAQTSFTIRRRGGSSMNSSATDSSPETPFSSSSLSSGSPSSISPIPGKPLYRKKSVHFNDKPRTSSPRTMGQNVIRLISLYLVSVAFMIPASLMVSLTTILLTPLYNSYPLTLHTPMVYAAATIVLALVYWLLTSFRSARDIISARVCLNVSALAGDAVAVSGRRIGSLCGLLGGPQWGAVVSRTILCTCLASGVGGFCLLCLDHALPVSPGRRSMSPAVNLVNVTSRSLFCMGHIYIMDHFWTRLLRGSTSFIVQHPEKSILLISLYLTCTSVLMQPPRGRSSLSQKVHAFLSRRLRLSRESSRNLESFTSLLPSQLFPVLLLLRIPLLILSTRQQLFLRLAPPYVAASGTLRILSSERGITGQIVVAENLERDYRFLRCDASILGGRWIRSVPNDSDRAAITMGDSIFAAFPMQEIGLLVHRSDPSESLMRTISLTTDLEIVPEIADATEENGEEQQRALIIGLGIGITASTFAQRGLALDVVELDPVVYKAAINHFGLRAPSESDTVNIIDGSVYLSELSRVNNDTSGQLQKWSHVVHDCFTGGGVPGEVFTKEFWEDLISLTEDDGIVVVNVASIIQSPSSKSIIRTLLSVFTQCRAFVEPTREIVEVVNMVILCTMAYSPLLTFRPPTHLDIQRSRIRSHVYSTFHDNEISLHDLLGPEDWSNPLFLLSRNDSTTLRDDWQGTTSFATWRAMQKLLSRDMWMAW